MLKFMVRSLWLFQTDACGGHRLLAISAAIGGRRRSHIGNVLAATGKYHERTDLPKSALDELPFDAVVGDSYRQRRENYPWRR